MSALDVWNRAPRWVAYGEYVGGGSNKFYEARVDAEGGSWVLTKRFGARPDTRGGQTRQESFATSEAAITAGTKVFNEKESKGYVQCAWPHGLEPIPDLNDPKAVEAWLSS